VQFDLFDSGSNTILGATSYEEFKRRLVASNCTRCGLHKGRTQIVVDRGNPQSSILVIGEGPGEQEDQQGKAFVGRAGQLFDQIMSAVGIDTNRDMLIANVVKCRPPENRSPHEEEAASCLPFLKRQIDLVAPKVILLLGATALKHIDKTRTSFQMADEAGKFFTMPEYPGVQFMVLYHPAALLYNAKLKPAMWEHAKSLRRFLDQQRLSRAGAAR
jgi:uracil-DNA glycosylase family 4